MKLKNILKKAIAMMMCGALMSVSGVQAIVPAAADSAVEEETYSEDYFGTWHEATTNKDEHYLWRADVICEEYKTVKVTFSGIGDEVTVLEGELYNPKLPWKLLNDYKDGYIVTAVEVKENLVYVGYTKRDLVNYFDMGGRTIKEFTTYGNYFNDNNVTNNYRCGGQYFKIIISDCKERIDTSQYSKGFEEYIIQDGIKIHLRDTDPQYLAAYSGAVYLDVDEILDKGSFVLDDDIVCKYAPAVKGSIYQRGKMGCGNWVLTKDGDLYLYGDSESSAPYAYTIVTNDWGENADKIKRVHFMDRFLALYDDAFKDCVNLESIDLPCNEIESDVFKNCTSLKEITYSRWTSGYDSVVFDNCPECPIVHDGNIFKGLSAIEYLEIPHCVSTSWNISKEQPVRHFDLSGCSSLKKIKRSTKFITVDIHDCESLESYEVFDTDTEIPELPKNLKYLYIPPTMTDAAIKAPKGCKCTVRGVAGSSAEKAVADANEKYGCSLKFEDITKYFNITEKNGLITGGFYEQDNAKWTLDKNGILTISGKGKLNETASSVFVPWFKYADKITEVNVEEGITAIMGNYFGECKNIERAVLPDSLIQSIENYSKAYVYNPWIASYFVDDDDRFDYDKLLFKKETKVAAHKGTYAHKIAKVNYNVEELPTVDNGYISGIDNWSFLNTSDYFRSENDHFMLDSYKEKLLSEADDSVEMSKVSNTEKARIEKMLAGKWNGSCWGMAVTSILSCYDIFDVSRYNDSAKTLNDLENTEEVESLLNYYWALQFTNEMRSRISEYKKKKDKEKIDDLLESVANGKPTLMAFSFPGGDHAVVAYKCSPDTCKKEEITYNLRIDLYDNITGTTRLMYINTLNNGYYQWIIEDYKAEHNSKLEKNNTASITFVSSDVEQLNYHGYLSGNYSKTGAEYTSSLETSSINGLENVQPAEGDENKALKIERTVSYDGDGNETSNFLFTMDDEEKGCRHTSVKPCENDLTMDFENCILSLKTSNSDEAVFYPEGEYISFKGEDSDYEINMIFNDEERAFDWHDVSIFSPNGTDDLSIKRAYLEKDGRNGYILKCPDMDNIKVTATDGNSKVSASFSTNYDSVLIYETKKKIGVLADPNHDGMYDTPVETSSLYRINDLVKLQRYLVRSDELSELETKLYNTCDDDTIDAFDLAAMLRNAVGKAS